MPGEAHTVSFDVTVIEVPQEGKIINNASVDFSYRLTPDDPVVSDKSTSNSVTTYIKLGKIKISKEGSLTYATIGDKIKYSFLVENTGNTPCFNLFFQDNIQKEAEFIPGSVIVNDIPSDYNPNLGFKLPDLKEKESLKLSFEVLVKELPDNFTINNTSIVNYSFMVDPNKPYINKEVESNTVNTIINKGELLITKEVSKDFATVQDILIYKVNVVNSGNVNITNINFRDAYPLGLNFVEGSVTINGEEKPSYNPYNSFSLGNLKPGEAVEVKFSCKVTSLPSPSLISNYASLTYTYRINPDGPDKTFEKVSNSADTKINLGKIAINKDRDKEYVTIGDTITYTLDVINAGNVDAYDVYFVDELQEELDFKEGSVSINGEKVSSLDPRIGFNLGTIETLQKVKVAFTVTVKNNPSKYSILNFAKASFSYYIDPKGKLYSASSFSNTVVSLLAIGGLSASKLKDISYATIDDFINYKMTFINTGSVVISNLIFKDIISEGASFVDGSVVINDISYDALNPIKGITLPDLDSGNAYVIKFKVKVISLTDPAYITNYGLLNGTWRIDPKGSDILIEAKTNTVSTKINVGSMSAAKNVNKEYAKVSDTLSYVSLFTNTGNVDAKDLWFSDNLQEEMSFVPGTVQINNIFYPSLNPVSGFKLPDLVPNEYVNVAFDVTIDKLPISPSVSNNSEIQYSYKIDPDSIIITKTLFSNTVKTNVILGKLLSYKSVDKTLATLDDILSYTIKITNIGNSVASDIFFKDMLGEGASFIKGSLKINGSPKEDLDPTIGFELDSIGIGNTVTIFFNALVSKVPKSNKILNESISTFKYIVNPKEPPFNETSYSNVVTTNVVLGSLSVIKNVDKEFATRKEILTYTIVITNTGNIDATNVVFLDPTPLNSAFVPDSVIVNGEKKPGLNPSAGFSLGTLKPSEIVTIIYEVQVIS